MTLPANVALCRIFTLYLGTAIISSPAPRGDCFYCCPIREVQDIKFLLYTRNNPIEENRLIVNDLKRFKNSNINMTNPLILYIHGFSESAPGGDGQSSHKIRDAFLKSGAYNVVLVDWSPITAFPWYTNAVQNIPRTARYIARFIRFLVNVEFPIANIYVIGFSLGAEVAGFSGQQLKEWGISIPRITGLDPALPLFEERSSRRLGPNDAEFVDVIHTDGGILGNPQPMGHADFYPNGGIPLQPGCARQEIENNRWLGILVGCSHQRAWEYFLETIESPQAFYANRCEVSTNSSIINLCRDKSKAYMGMGANKRLRGKFYLDTNDAPPYGKNHQTIL